jgi:Rrf2 family protein
MKISTKAQYGLRAMAYLAERSKNKFCSAREVASAENIPFEFLEKIISKLERAGFLQAKKGASGGYKLARPAKNIKLGEIVDLLEGKTSLVKCTADLGPSCCPNHRRCKTKNYWLKVQRILDEALNAVSLADLNR